ncbi:MAG: bifunctional aspartate kinase/homoserine dehydrogenase I, partial [Acidobacteria bacterium]|nr:bifunctional aspartate kinase/homoserine dehydrogenase I [Acidobacteriota bacterium]
GVAGRLFSALASADINVVAISQGSSERAISAVVDGAGATRALRVAHQFFFNTTRSIDLVIMGVGAVGSELLDQLARQRASLLGQDIELRVIGVANSSRLLLDESAIQLDNWRERLAASPKPSTLSEVRDFIRQVKPLNPVLVDCTSSDEIAGSYVDFFCAGLHVVTANKKANSAGLSYYRALRRTANANGRRFLYEATVGAGLPVIDTLQGLIASGDRLEAFSGILSGSLSFLFGLLEEGVEFSAAVRIARERRFTEPDPREDLSGLDVARKLLILMREAGGEQELPGIRIDPILPADFDCTGRTEDFLLRARQLDGHFARRIDRLKAEGKALRFAAEMRGGRGRVGLVEVDRSHPLCSIRGGENTLVFHTTRYAPMPLVIRGYGAGAQVTAAGVFADIMRVKFRGQAP